MNTIDILKKAKQLLIDKGWTQGTLARDVNGDDVDPDNAAAACFCIMGAFDAVHGGPAHTPQVLYDLIGGSVVQFNDAPGRTVDEVLAKFDEAIALEEAKVAP